MDPLPSKLLENYAVKARIRLKAARETGGSSRHGSHAVANAVPYRIYNGKKIELSVLVVFIFTIYHIADYF